MRNFINIFLCLGLLVFNYGGVEGKRRKFVTKDYDVTNIDEVFTIDIDNDGVIGKKPKYYNLVFHNLENGVVMTKLRKIAVSPKRRQALGFVKNRLDRRENISVVSPDGFSVHTFRVKRRLLKRDKLALLRLRQFIQDPEDSEKILFVKETNVRINIIPDETDDCIAIPTCARLDYEDVTVFKEYPTTCIGGGVAVDSSNCT